MGRAGSLLTAHWKDRLRGSVDLDRANSRQDWLRANRKEARTNTFLTARLKAPEDLSRSNAIRENTQGRRV